MFTVGLIALIVFAAAIGFYLAWTIIVLEKAETGTITVLGGIDFFIVVFILKLLNGRKLEVVAVREIDLAIERGNGVEDAYKAYREVVIEHNKGITSTVSDAIKALVKGKDGQDANRRANRRG
jgi:hypothetical protein